MIISSLSAIIILCLVHLFSVTLFKKAFINHARLLSFAGGVAISYVFIDLIPKLCENNEIFIKSGWFPYLERHVFFFALIGFLSFYLSEKKREKIYTLFSYLLFNFFIGYAVADRNDPDVRPLALFTFALGLHFFTSDYELGLKERILAVLFLFLGWASNFAITLPPAAVALVTAYIAGGVIMNVTRHEIPSHRPTSPSSFLTGAFFYTAIIMLQQRG